MAKTKTPKSSTKKSTPDKKVASDLFEVYEIFTGRMKPVSDDWLENLGRKILKWAMELKEPETIRSFFRNEGLCYRDIPRWKARNDSFAQNYERAIETLGDLREKGALTKKLDGAHVRWGQRLYGPVWQEHCDYMESLKQKEQNQSKGDVVIQMVDYGEKHEEKDMPPVPREDKV